MKRTIRKNITGLPYCLHDMSVTGMRRDGDELTLEFENGYESTAGDLDLVAGEICFHGVDWDFCWAYTLDFCGNVGSFTGHKRFLADFAATFKRKRFEIISESYGYNTSRFSGCLSVGREEKECVIEIYHLGDMEYITQE